MNELLKEMGVKAEEVANHIVIYYGSEVDDKARERMFEAAEKLRKKYGFEILELITI